MNTRATTQPAKQNDCPLRLQSENLFCDIAWDEISILLRDCIIDQVNGIFRVMLAEADGAFASQCKFCSTDARYLAIAGAYVGTVAAVVGDDKVAGSELYICMLARYKIIFYDHLAGAVASQYHFFVVQADGMGQRPI